METSTKRGLMQIALKKSMGRYHNKYRKTIVEGVTTGLKHPTGKRKRLIILHIGNEDGFIENGLLCLNRRRVKTTIKI
ncbi:hypothetical protein Trydic_g19976 [Trypoxylus dichotomus]